MQHPAQFFAVAKLTAEQTNVAVTVLRLCPDVPGRIQV